METTKATTITVQADVNAPIEKVWKYWTEPQHITQWCAASDDWHAPYAENDVKKDGKFKTTMAAKDGSVSFDFEGVYTNIDPKKRIDYRMSDGRQVTLIFSDNGKSTHISETFDPENTHSLEQQREGWQAILNNFKAYAERS